MGSEQINRTSLGAAMTKNHNDSVGDKKSPPLRPEERGLRTASDQASFIAADRSAPAAMINGQQSVAAALKATGTSDKRPTCKQTLWVSFFFDGTGNNLDADEGLSKHSNVAKLFRVHVANDTVNGNYAVYIPGVGTYFPAIGDDGGSKLGLGTGAMGEERLEYALGKLDSYLATHLSRAQASPSAAIVEINMAVFGFSRGAALARAFVNMVLKERCVKNGHQWVLSNGKWPMRFRFMGLFDTVASVGMPMSSNTTSKTGVFLSSVKYMIDDRLQSYLDTRPASLAFAEGAKPGADPAPGKYDGHVSWGGRLAVDNAVEEVRHFVAAHENRNSFPVDSISTLSAGVITKPAHFFETVYPGAHSDVGGSYAPGEGGRSGLRVEKLGLIPLIHMYHFAMAKGVPLLPVTAWSKIIRGDFEISKVLIETYNGYLKKVGGYSTLGTGINRHMGLYFAWRFRSIRLKAAGNRDEATRISARSDEFRNEEARIDKEISQLEKIEANANAELNDLISRRAEKSNQPYGLSSARPVSKVIDSNIQEAQERKKRAHHDVLSAKARKLANPDMDNLLQMLDIYDAQLMNDTKAIRDAIARYQKIPKERLRPGQNKGLRPHYRLLVEAYENEFEKNQGLTDPKIISFFDNYVHDSLAGFAGDATLPSDPRVVYLGGDEKYQYASHLMDGAVDERVQGMS